VTRRPALARRMALANPPGPAPMIMISLLINRHQMVG
jgi:hypothetical protein